MRTRTASTFLVTLAQASCCSTPLAPLARAPASDQVVTPTPQAEKPSLAGWTDEQARKLKESLDATWDTFRSPLFRSKLSEVANVHDRVGGQPVPGPAMAVALFTTGLPVVLSPGDTARETGHTGISNGRALTSLGTANLDRWLSGGSVKEIVSRACLINTLSHELLHSVPDGHGGERFLDDGHKCSPVPLASYTFGSLAQCAYLTTYRAMTEDRFWSCVDAVGTRVFNGLSVCESTDWLSRLESAPLSKDQKAGTNGSDERVCGDECHCPRAIGTAGHRRSGPRAHTGELRTRSVL